MEVVTYDPDELIYIPQYEYDQLVESQALLAALRRAGVDNWDGYDYAIEIYEGTSN